MAEMSKKGLLRAQSFGESQTFSEAHVGRMWSAARSAKDQRFNSFETFKPLGVHGFAVTQVSRQRTTVLPEKETENVGLAMLQGDWIDFRAAKSESAFNQMRFWMYVPREARLAVECVKEDSVQVLHGVLRCIDRNPPAIDRTEPPEVIETHYMIRVRMGVENGIDFLNVRAESLNSELRACIDYPATVDRLHIDGRPQPLIPGIFRLADLARATNYGYSHGCAGTQKCDR